MSKIGVVIGAWSAVPLAYWLLGRVDFSIGFAVGITALAALIPERNKT